MNENWGRVRLRERELVFLRELLLEDRDQFFEEKRALDAAGTPSIGVLRDIRAVEKIMKNVEGTIEDVADHTAAHEEGKNLCPTCDGRGHIWVFPREVSNAKG